MSFNINPEAPDPLYVQEFTVGQEVYGWNMNSGIIKGVVIGIYKGNIKGSNDGHWLYSAKIGPFYYSQTCESHYFCRTEKEAKKRLKFLIGMRMEDLRRGLKEWEFKRNEFCA